MNTYSRYCCVSSIVIIGIRKTSPGKGASCCEDKFCKRCQKWAFASKIPRVMSINPAQES